VKAYDGLPLHVVGGAGDQGPIAVPHAELSANALAGVIKAFVLREGTDYGEREFTLEQKIAHVRAQLESGDAQILFDSYSASVDIVRTPGRWR
jgi:uncharacterized protein YheU (UPF0270 family)